MTDKEIRLTYAARAIHRSLKQGRHAVAHSLVSYILRHNTEFGLARPTIDERKQITALKHGCSESEYLSGIIACASRSIEEDDSWQLMTAAGYLAALLASGDLEPLKLASLAMADMHVQNILLLSVFGASSNTPVNAVPTSAVALIAYATGAVSTDKIIAEVFASRSYREAELITARHVFKAAGLGPNSSSFETSASDPANQSSPVNGIAFSGKIIDALRGEHPLAYARAHEHMPSSAQAHVVRSLAETLKIAEQGDVHGLHFALRSKNPREAAKVVLANLAEHAIKPVQLCASGLNDLLAEMIAHQVACLMSTSADAVRPLVIIDDFDLLGAPEEILATENTIDDGSPSVTRAYDTVSMSEQKMVLHDKSDIFIAPTIWLIDDARPVTEELIGTLAEIATLPTDEVAERAIAIVAIGERHGLAIDEKISRRVAASITNVEDIDGVIKLAALRGSAEDLLRSSRKLLAGSKSIQSLPAQAPDRFDIRFVRSTSSIPDVIRKLTPLRDRPISVLFHGDPGTSKSSVARHIAERMGMKIIVRKYSEIAGWRVSDTEKGISRAFAEAVAEDAFLILDECDSILRSRDKAQHHWEQSTVNEALTCMDTHPLPFACTTNYLRDLDAAAVRRFKFKIEMLAMDQPRARLAWTELLKLPEDEFPLGDQMENLTIADFALVAEKMDILNEQNAKFAIAALAAEKATRESKQSRPIGFLAQKA